MKAGALRKYGCGPAVFAAAFAVYLLTLCPTVYVEGSGELIGAVHFLGTPHPTGYPLFCLWARLFSAFLPWGGGRKSRAFGYWKKAFCIQSRELDTMPVGSLGSI